LKKELKKGNNQSRFENNSKILNDILNNQRPSSNKLGLGYDQNIFDKGSNTTTQKSNKSPNSYATTLQSSFKKEERKINTDSNQKYALHSKENEYRRNTTTRRTPPKRYQHLFLGYYFSCNNFGHKALHSRSYGKNNHKSVLVVEYDYLPVS
jgi:hypothetical protein